MEVRVIYVSEPLKKIKIFKFAKLDYFREKENHRKQQFLAKAYARSFFDYLFRIVYPEKQRARK